MDCSGYNHLLSGVPVCCKSHNGILFLQTTMLVWAGAGTLPSSELERAPAARPSSPRGPACILLFSQPRVGEEGTSCAARDPHARVFAETRISGPLLLALMVHHPWLRPHLTGRARTVCVSLFSRICNANESLITRSVGQCKIMYCGRTGYSPRQIFSSTVQDSID